MSVIVDLYLYRLKLVFPAQSSLFEPHLKRPDIFREALDERPSVEVRAGQSWHVGNVHFIDETGGYFAAGKTTKSILEKYDEDTGDFVVETLETSPYTHILFDSQIGFLAIARKTKLAPTTKGIARSVAKLLQEAEVIRRNEIQVSLDPISDPRGFIESIEAAYSVKKFEVTFSRSNPFDADEFFQKPMEKYLDAANARKGKTAVSGEDLDADTLITMTKSVAATGNDATAVLKPSDDAKYISKRLSGDPAHTAIPEEEFDPESALVDSRKTYARVRGDVNVLDND